MSRRVVRAGISTAILIASACVTLAARAETEGKMSDSGIEGPPYAVILNNLSELQRLHPDWAQAVDYGRSAQGRTLRLLKIQAPRVGDKDLEARQAVLISGSTHGNEYLAIEDRLPGHFLAARETSPGLQRFLASGGILYLVPIMNPDGYERDARENSRGVDLNRDFDLLPARETHFREVETRRLAEYLERELAQGNPRLRLTIDYHCCDGSLLFPWAYSDTPIPAADYAAHEHVAKLMQRHVDPRYNYGPTGPVLGYNPRGTSKDYYYARYGALAFTFEGTYRVEAQKFQAHTAFWDAVLGYLADSNTSTIQTGGAE